MKPSKVFTEEPENELWRALLRFSYKENIKRYFQNSQIERSQDQDALENFIAGAMLQADEYYKASKMVSMQVEPIMLYYGTTNLFFAMAALLSGIIPNIKAHGMRIDFDDNSSYIANTKIIFNNPSKGGIHLFNKLLGDDSNLCQFRPWYLMDFFDSIAEIRDDFEDCYYDQQSKILMLDVVKTAEGEVDKINLDEDSALETLERVKGFESAYLNPQKAYDKNNKCYVVLRRKLNGIAIEQLAYSGQPYLQVGHKKGDKIVTISNAICMYVSLFALCSLCRYHPEKWNPFVMQDTTGEKLLVEKLLYYSRRILPNIVLNKIKGVPTVFVSDKYSPDDRVHLVGEHEAKEIANREARDVIKRELAKNTIIAERR